MRDLLLFWTACLWCLPSLASAQFLPPEIKKVHVGFQAYQEGGQARYKVGLWTPIHIEVFGGSEGVLPKPNSPFPHVIIETVDSEDAGTQIPVPVLVEPLKTRTFMGYVKTGHMSNYNDIRIRLSVNDREKPREVDPYQSIGIDQHLYVTIGSKITDLHRAVQKMAQRDDDKNELGRGMEPTRHVAYENVADRLPDYWFGYNSVDLLVLSTDNKEFLKDLLARPEKLKALAQWVRRGGRLVVPVSWQSQDVLAAVFEEGTAWDPPIPVVPPRSADGAQVTRLARVEEWGGARGVPFHRFDPANPQNHPPIMVARLDPGKVPPGAWEVMVDGEDSRAKDGAQAAALPLIARVRYGLGQIVYLGFSLEDKHFYNWGGKEQFLKKMVEKLAPRAPAEVFNQWDKGGRGMGNATDLSTDLLGQLDSFDVTVIPFGYVALFIILYILVVGPLDFILLKYVFKRLEWTWITFPTVVLAVSVIAYFAAYALKGRDLKINKVDIVDFDLRTDLGDVNRKPSVHAYGQSFFTILSPRIQNYTIGLEPNGEFWGDKSTKIRSVDMLSWMGRPSGGPHDMGRSGSSGFFNRSYKFRYDASGLEGVPIPVWTTKAFSASWEQKLDTPPFSIDLVYHQKDQDVKVSGKLASHLGAELVDVWLIYDDRCFAIPQGLKTVKTLAEGQAIHLTDHDKVDMKNWVNQEGPAEDQPRTSNPTRLIKEIMFHERYDTQGGIRNHLLRPLDLGWRIKEEPLGQRDRRTREAILFGRVRLASGAAETLTRDQALPSKLWLGDIPDPSDPRRTRPTLNGRMNQDTYIRVLLPVRPAEE